MPSRFRRKIIDQAFYDRGCLKEFCEETSLAGFKYLLPQYGPLIRRLMWTVVCLVFTIITIYQLAQQIMGYINTPLAVDISKQYPQQLTFPGVVICNSMPYRVSRVRPKSNMHLAFSEMYKTPKLDAKKAVNYKTLLSDIKNTQSYLREIAFAKEDMIAQCVWQHHEKCSADDFNIEIVDSRICYSFNTGINGTRTVDHAGEDNGLELTLNIETYERMQGPYTTFGAIVSFFPQNHRPTLQGAVNTLIGASTKIGLRQKQIKYYLGETCDTKILKYFGVYSRSSCILERQIQSVADKCGCLPYFVNETKAFGDVKSCNLYQHFQCAEEQLGEAQTVGEDECPKDCDVVSYEASVSQSRIAWDQAQSTLRGEYSSRTKLDEKLLLATEIRHRFDPDYNSTTSAFLESLRDATANVTNLINDINNMTCYDSLIIPAGGTVPAISDSFDLMESYLIKSEGSSLVETVGQKLIKMNESMSESQLIFGNETYLDYFLANPNISEEDTMEDLGLPTEFFSLSDRKVYLNTLKKWLEGLVGIKTVHQEFNKSMTSLPKSWRFIMHKNDSLTFDQARTELLDVGFQPGCLDEPYVVEELDENTTRTDYLIDVISCFHYYYSSENTKQIQAVAMVDAVSFFTEHTAEIEVQSVMCSKLMCRIIEDEVGHNCTLDPEKLKQTMLDAFARLEYTISNCSDKLEKGNSDIEEFLNSYRNSTLPTYNDISQKMISYKAEAEVVRLRLSDPIWPINPSLNRILNNVSAFEYGGVNFKQLAENVTQIHSEFLENTFPFTANAARSNLETLLESLKKLDEYTEILFDNMESFTLEEQMEGFGIFQILANNLLWQNETIEGLDRISQCTAEIRNQTKEFLNQLPGVQTSYKNRGEKLIYDSREYLERLQMDNAFFDRNFMVVSVYFQEISNDLTVQRSSYNFWSLMADIGGASGLWLGFCMVTLVEFVEMFIRHIVCSATNFVYSKNKDKFDGAFGSVRGQVHPKVQNGFNPENPSTGEKWGGVNDFNLDTVWDRSNSSNGTVRTRL